MGRHRLLKKGGKRRGVSSSHLLLARCCFEAEGPENFIRVEGLPRLRERGVDGLLHTCLRPTKPPTRSRCPYYEFCPFLCLAIRGLRHSDLRYLPPQTLQHPLNPKPYHLKPSTESMPEARRGRLRAWASRKLTLEGSQSPPRALVDEVYFILYCCIKLCFIVYYCILLYFIVFCSPRRPIAAIAAPRRDLQSGQARDQT